MDRVQLHTLLSQLPPSIVLDTLVHAALREVESAADEVRLGVKTIATKTMIIASEDLTTVVRPLMADLGLACDRLDGAIATHAAIREVLS